MPLTSIYKKISLIYYKPFLLSFEGNSIEKQHSVSKGSYIGTLQLRAHFYPSKKNTVDIFLILYQFYCAWFRFAIKCCFCNIKINN